MTRTAAVVVAHRTPDRAVRCAGSLARAGADEVLVVDAGSGAADVARVRAAGVRVLALPNLGFGRAANAGVAALPADVDVVVVCNADTVWDDAAVAHLAGVVRSRRDVVAAGPRVEFPDGTVQASARSVPGPVTAVMHGLLGPWAPGNRWTRSYRGDATVARDAEWLSGCALALDRAAFVAVGGFDPGYFLYVEDVDLGVRLRAAGGRLRTVPGARVVHEVGASTDLVPVARVRWHARSLERFAGHHVLRGPLRLARPLLRLALRAWAASVVLRGRLGAGGPSTGERTGRG